MVVCGIPLLWEGTSFIYCCCVSGLHLQIKGMYETKHLQSNDVKR